MKRFRYQKRKFKIILFIFLFISSVYYTFNFLESKKIVINDKTIVKMLINDKFSINSKEDKFKKWFNKLVRLNISYSQLTKPDLVKKVSKIENKNINKEPLIYIYNTHPTEEYIPNQFLEYTIKPTVLMPSYMMKEIFDKSNYPSIVEEQSVSEILRENNWNYAYSYKASRMLIDKAKLENSTLKYFIDVHRDSVNHERTTVDIGDKKYAKLLFIVGLENPNYKENLEFTEQINEELEKNYPNISRGIYKKEGPGVNGIYNQDNSKYTILVEMGGNESTIDEVMNSTIAFVNCFIKILNEIEGDTNEG